jgi:hypothetical protein
MDEKTTHIKQLSVNHVCKIGFNLKKITEVKSPFHILTFKRVIHSHIHS